MAEAKTKLEAAMQLSEDELYQEIGQYDIATGRTHYLDIPDAGSVGKHLWKEVQNQVHELVCGKGKDWEVERDAIHTAFNQGIIAAGAALAAALPALIPAGIAAFVAALVIRLIYKGAWEATCKAWVLPQPDPGIAI